LQLCYEERISDLEARNVKLQRNLDELTCGDRRHSGSRELDDMRRRHRGEVADLERTIDGLRQQLLKLQSSELGACELFISRVLQSL